MSARTKPPLTDVQKKALRTLQRHGGEAVQTRTGTMLARGVELGHGEDGEGDREEGVDFFQRSTWAGLKLLGMIDAVAPRRYRITDAGQRALGPSS